MTLVPSARHHSRKFSCLPIRRSQHITTSPPHRPLPPPQPSLQTLPCSTSPSRSSSSMPSPSSKEADIHSWRKLLPYTNNEYSNPLYYSRCHCGKVKFSVNTAPLDAKLCHCRDCRVMHGAPMQHAAIFEKKAVQFEEGSLDHVRFYANERGSNRGNEGEEGHGKVSPLFFCVRWPGVDK